jgi:hypothetical protein
MPSNTPYTFMIDPKLLERVRHEASRNRRTVGAELMVLIEDALAARRPVLTATNPMPLGA